MSKKRIEKNKKKRLSRKQQYRLRRSSYNVRKKLESLTLKQGPSYTKHTGVVDYLDEDDIIPGQELALIAFAELTGDQKKEYIQKVADILEQDLNTVNTIIEKWCELSDPKRAIKLRGVWPNSDHSKVEMKQMVDKYRSLEEPWHTLVGEVGKWLPFSPDPDKIQDQDYYEKELNELIKGHRISKMQSKQYFKQRKEQMMQKAIYEGTPEGQAMLMKQEEPIEAVEHRIKAAEEVKQELLDKIQEAEQTKIAAEKKLQYMKEQIDKGKEYPKLENIRKEIEKRDDPKLLDVIDNDPPSLNEIDKTVTAVPEEHREAIKKIREIDRNRAHNIQEIQQNNDNDNENVFKDDIILPHEQREKYYSEESFMSKVQRLMMQDPGFKNQLINAVSERDTEKVI